jgi:hypothetical protein
MASDRPSSARTPPLNIFTRLWTSTIASSTVHPPVGVL